MIIILISINLLLSIIFTLLNHPISIGIILFIQTCLISLLTGIINFNWWFRYILFLIIIGGILILFIYITRIASNEKFKITINLPLIFLFISFLLFRFFILEIYELESFNSLYELEFNLNKFINFPNLLIIFLIIIYLFIVLIATVNITNINYGPLRHIN